MFKRLSTNAYARTADFMSTQSANGFEWSIKLFGKTFFVGIASKLKADELYTHHYDENAILYCCINGVTNIKIGENILHSNLTTHKNEDVISFRFQPHAKKLVIDLVRV